MPNLSGMSPLTIKLTDTLLQLAQRLKPDQVLRAVVSETPQGLSVKVSGTRIALPQNTTLVSGQAVTVQLQTQSGTPQILIQPLNVAPANIPATPDATTVLAQIMKELPGLLSLSPQEGASLIPAALPSSNTIIRLALQIFQLQAGAPEAAGTLLRTLRKLSGKGETKPVADQLLALLDSEIDPEKPESIVRFLKRVQVHTQGAPVSGMVDQAVASAPLVPRSDAHLYLLLAGIRNDQSIQALLEPTGELKLFQKAVDTLMDHAAGQHLQNARGLDIPYTYMNIPFANDTIRQAQIHILGDGQGNQNEGDGESGQIVLDLDTSQLGPLWIHVQHSTEQCACRFDVATEEIATHINDAAKTLEARLEGLSFKTALVKASVWDGDRMKAAAKLFQRFSGLDVKA